MTRLVFYDDLRARQFAPFSLTRPASELISGALTARSRWERISGLQSTAFMGAAHLKEFDEAEAPSSLDPSELLEAGTLIVNSRFTPSLGQQIETDDIAVLTAGDTVCAVRLSEPTKAADIITHLADGSPLEEIVASDKRDRSRNIEGRWLDHIWDYIGNLSSQLTDDIEELRKGVATTTAEYQTIGDYSITIERGAVIEPYVLFDVTSGPIMVREGARICGFTKLVGPCYVDRHATVLGEMVGNCSIGPWSKIRGEIHSSIILGFSNKGHAGFVGHSYLGKWVNLGAGTTTSNLKNTYGNVQLWTPSGVTNTGMLMIGTLFGDHAKTGIGTMLNTGTVLSVGANVYGANMPAKYVPPFAWGDGEPYGKFQIDKFLVVAARVMKRREVVLSDKQKSLLSGAYDNTVNTGDI